MLRFATVVFVIVVAAVAATTTADASADAATVATRIDVCIFYNNVHAFFYFVVIRTFLPCFAVSFVVGWLVGRLIGRSLGRSVWLTLFLLLVVLLELNIHSYCIFTNTYIVSHVYMYVRWYFYSTRLHVVHGYMLNITHWALPVALLEL